MSLETVFHFGCGVLGMIAGATALLTRKGGQLHVAAGRVFLVAMTATAISAIYLAIRIGNYGFAIGGVLVVYMLATAWMAAHRPDAKAGGFEIGAFLLAGAGAAASLYFGVTSVLDGTALLGGIPAFGFAIVIGLAAAGDLSVVLRRGIAGRQRIARHLWRMHMGLFAAVGSFFPGQLQIFPEAVRSVRPLILLFIPAFSVIGLMLVWLGVVLLTRRFANRPAAS